MSGTPVNSTSLVLRVTRVRPWRIAVAAINVSITGRLQVGEQLAPTAGRCGVDGQRAVGEGRLDAVDPRAKLVGAQDPGPALGCDALA